MQTQIEKPRLLPFLFAVGFKAGHYMGAEKAIMPTLLLLVFMY